MDRMPEEQQQEFARVDVRDYLQVLWRGKFIILITTVLVVAGAFFYSYLQENEYQSYAEMIVAPRDISEIVPGFSSGAVATGGANGRTNPMTNELIFMGTESMRDRVQERLGRSPEVAFANTPEGSAVVRITAVGSNATRVAEDANVFVEEYIADRREKANDDLVNSQAALTARKQQLETQRATIADPTSNAYQQVQAQIAQIDTDLANISSSLLRFADPAQNPPVGAEQIRRAVVPDSPESPQPLKNALAALGIGLVLGIALAFLREYLDDTIKTKEDVERASGLTVVGMIPQLADWKDRASSRLAARESPTGPTAEAYRTLRTSIQFLGLERTIRTLLVTSPAAGEGKSTTAANLAITFAHAGQRVVLLSSDFRRPRVHSFFGLSNQVGFTSVLLGETPFSEALQTVPDEPYVTVLPSGPRPPNPSELLNSRRAAEAIAALAGRFDLVLIDSPPVLPVSDSLVIAGLADAILVVARAGQTRKKGLHRSIELLRQVEAPLVGAVLNGADGGNDYGYGSEYHPEQFAPRQVAAPPNAMAGNGKPSNGRRGLFSRSKQG
jgi:receptor protein-tyrosine kinase